MDILISVTTFPAYIAGVFLLAILSDMVSLPDGPPVWLRLLKKAILYATLLIFLFLAYTFLLSIALSISHLYFLLTLVVLTGCTSFLIPRFIVNLLGLRMRWFARSVAAFGYAFVILTLIPQLLGYFSLNASIPRYVFLLVAAISLGLVAFPRLIRAR